MKADSPTPNKVSASPVATWLVCKVSARKPNSSAISMPASIAASKPKQHGCRCPA